MTDAGKTAETPESRVRPTLIAIASVFTRYSNFTVGGAGATIGVLQKEVQDKRAWINHDQFNLCYGVSTLAPGTNLLAFCTGIGWLVRGWRGAVAALTAASLPCSVIAVVVTILVEVWTKNSLMKSAMRGALASAVGIIFYTCWQLLGPSIRRTNALRMGVIAVAAVVLQTVFSISPVWVVILAALAGAVWPKEAGA
jgi:chromate transporter